MFQDRGDVDFLRAFLCAKTAGDTGGSFLFIFEFIVIALEAVLVAAEFVAVVKFEVFGDIHADRAGHTVAAAGTESETAFLEGGKGVFDDLLFLCLNEAIQSYLDKEEKGI